MRDLKKMEKLIQSSCLKSGSDQEEKILGNAFAALERIKETRLKTKQKPARARIVKYKWLELANAAAIIVAVFAASWYFSGSVDGTTVAWAQVADKVKKIETFTYRQRTSNLQAQQAETVHNFSQQYGFHLGTYSNEKINTRKFFLPAKKTVITIMPQEKKYTENPLTPKEYDELQQFHDPRKLIEQFMSGQYTELDTCTIDGIVACGIETEELNINVEILKNPVGRLWVNPSTNLPVRMELEGVAKDGNRVKIVTDEFRWDAKLQAADFTPNINSDYKLNRQQEK